MGTVIHGAHDFTISIQSTLVGAIPPKQSGHSPKDIHACTWMSFGLYAFTKPVETSAGPFPRQSYRFVAGTFLTSGHLSKKVL